MSIQVIATVKAWRAYRAALPAGTTVGFVPTMGALHEGHAVLAQRAAEENGVAVASIFVNPTQFDNAWDLQHYPRTVPEDLAMLEAAGVRVAFVPSVPEMYPDRQLFRVTERELSGRFCGAHRPGHFDGVLTVVLKLLQAVAPDRAYFGEKDWQQLQLVRRLVEAFFLPVEIVPCATVREADGLAMSSRNRHLSPEQRRLAGRFNVILRTAATPEDARAALAESGFEVDYVEDWEGRRLGAVRVGPVRLIDNLVPEPPASRA
jgi:pantoate--beta-alanine ligase